MNSKSLIDKPKELLELIDSCLKPKQVKIYNSSMDLIYYYDKEW